MSVGYHEWSGVLFISVWRASACSHPGKKLCCLEVETGNRACSKTSILVLWMQFSFLRFKLKEGTHIQDRDRRHGNRGIVLKTCRLLLRLTCIFSQVLGVFPHGLLRRQKTKNCSSECVMKDKSSLQHKSDSILATESHGVNTTGYKC